MAAQKGCRSSYSATFLNMASMAPAPMEAHVLMAVLPAVFFFLGEGEREGEREREREREKGGRSTFACLCAFLSMYLDCSCVFICVDARLASGVCALLSIYLNYACVPPCQRFVRLRIYLSRLWMCVHLY